MAKNKPKINLEKLSQKIYEHADRLGVSIAFAAQEISGDNVAAIAHASTIDHKTTEQLRNRVFQLGGTWNGKYPLPKPIPTPEIQEEEPPDDLRSRLKKIRLQ